MLSGIAIQFSHHVQHRLCWPLYFLFLTKAVDMGHKWPKTRNNEGLYMVHMWDKNRFDMGYNTPYTTLLLFKTMENIGNWH